VPEKGAAPRLESFRDPLNRESVPGSCFAAKSGGKPVSTFPGFALASEPTCLTLFGAFQIAASTIIFLAAATVAKSWALSPNIGKLLLTLGLYSLGNLIMMRLVREFGMATAFSLSAVIQLVAVNVIALAWFGERLSTIQTGGIVLAILATALITVGPLFEK
jgi:multidrug transporter EmrE-like cation transporter